MPRPRAKTSVFAVPRSIAKSLENRLNIERRFIETDLEPLRVRSSLPAENSFCGCIAYLISRRALRSQHIAKRTLNEVIGKNQAGKAATKFAFLR
jgi:hypothetical protein